MNLKGYKRPDGRIGFRNHVLILPACACSGETCLKVAEQVPGVKTIINQNGCGEVFESIQITRKVLAGLAANPNVFGSIVIGLGCELNEMGAQITAIREKTNKPLESLLIQEEGGTIQTISKAAKLASRLVQEASVCEREDVGLSSVILGTECGGSDTTSGLAANPVLGVTCDKIIDAGGTAVLSETTELIGAEHILARRSVSPDIGKKILGIVSEYERHLLNAGQDLRRGQPGPGNKEGGITTLEEKSLGAIHKAGSRPVVDVVGYAEEIRKNGLVVMDTPAYDLASVTGMVAGGCQIVVFTTGRGTPMGNPIVPVIKITANRATYEIMRDNIDFDASDVVLRKRTIDSLGLDLFQEVVNVANGKQTKAEMFGFGFSEIAMNRICNYI